MNKKANAPKVHSEEYFGEYRDFWWNQDFLKLMSVRLQFEKIKTALDVGCGVGHWGQILAPVLPADVEMIGVDREERSLIQAGERANRQGLSPRYRYQHGDATSLPFEDDTFDFVTCQTVLIHLKDPKKGLQEMLRVLKPGGILFAVEPNNFANRAVASNLTDKLSVKEIIKRLEFGLTLERGKKAMGQGFNSEGDMIPGYLAELGAGKIQVYLSDKAVPYFAPYSSKEQEVNIQQMKDWAKRDFIGWDREEVKGYFIAGGGDSQEFDDHWNQAIQDAREAVESIQEGSYHSAGGGISYLISAVKR